MYAKYVAYTVIDAWACAYFDNTVETQYIEICYKKYSKTNFYGPNQSISFVLYYLLTTDVKYVY